LTYRESPYTPFLRRFTDERAKDAAETSALYNRVVSVFRASVWAQSGIIDHISNKIMDLVADLVEPPNSLQVCEALDTYQREVLKLESTIFSEPSVDFSRPLSPIEETDLKRHLLAQEYFLSHQDRIGKLLAATIGNVTVDIIESLPPISDSSFAVPLIILLRDPSEVVERIIAAFCHPEVIEAGLCAVIRARILQNIYEYSGVLLDGKSSRPLVRARDADLSPDELVDVYLGGTPLCDLLLTPSPFSLPQEQRFSGHWMVAPPGRGKTTLLHAMFLDDLSRDASIIVMDSKGDLIRPIKELAAVKASHCIDRGRSRVSACAQPA
jgi:hypothetical protein